MFGEEKNLIDVCVEYKKVFTKCFNRTSRLLFIDNDNVGRKSRENFAYFVYEKKWASSEEILFCIFQKLVSSHYYCCWCCYKKKNLTQKWKMIWKKSKQEYTNNM